MTIRPRTATLADRKTPQAIRSRCTAAERLGKALEKLMEGGSVGERRHATAANLCRIAGVSRNSLYRYHPAVVQALRDYQQQHVVVKSECPKNSDATKSELAGLRDQISKLATLVDHYYSAYREAAVLLERRARELAQLRRGLKSRPVVVS